MSTTNNPSSILTQLRAVVPHRPLTFQEALRIAELQANKLLELSRITDPGTPSEIISGLPFVKVIVRHKMPVSGSAQWFKPRWLILLNGQEPEVRRRFSLMHEWKHVLDHPFVDFLYPGKDEADRIRKAEQVADFFAACLLMPKKLIKRVYFQGFRDPQELAGMFGVSPQAMRYRIDQLALTEPYQRCRLPGRSIVAPTTKRYFRSLSASPLLLG